MDSIGRVASIRLGANNLVGSVPAILSYLTGLQELSVPDNYLDGIPDLTGLSRLSVVDVSGNRLGFEDLEPNVRLRSLSTFRYAAQDSIDTIQTRTFDGTVLTVSTGGRENRYQWYRNGKVIGSATMAELCVDLNAPWAIYHAKVAHPWFPGLTLSSRQVGVGPTGAVLANIADSLIVVELYTATQGDRWTNNAGWLQAPLIRWNGIALDSLGNVTTIYLNNNNLVGALPPRMGGLTRLRHLSLAVNGLSAQIPPELGKLSRLQVLQLNHNKLSGAIPPELGRLQELVTLYLYENELAGSIPPELGKLKNLRYLFLSANKLSGNIPIELGNLLQLHRLLLNDNELIGSVPPELSNLEMLEYLFLHDNYLSGTIPSELGSLERLTHLNLQGNRLSGSPPPELGDLTNLTNLELGDNQLTGSLPSELGNLKRLNSLRAARNRLSGSVPSEFAGLGWLQVLDVQHNRLESIPNLTGLSSLQYLDVSHNRLSFEHLESNAALTGRRSFIYAPQDSLDTVVNHSPNEFIFSVRAGGQETQYQWYRNGDIISGATEATLRIQRDSDVAEHYAEASNPLFPELTIVSRPRTQIDVPTAINETPPAAFTIGLHQNYPNPFSSETRIPFDVEKPIHVRIMIYDALGRQVHTLVDGSTMPGRHQVTFDAMGLAPGLYYYRMQAQDYTKVEAMVVLQ